MTWLVRGIPAHCHTDDWQVSVDFDAEPWFQDAPQDVIVALFECGGGNDVVADELATQSRDGGVVAVFDYLDKVREDSGFRDLMGFECNVGLAQAFRWLLQHRPGIMDEIRRSRWQGRCELW